MNFLYSIIYQIIWKEKETSTRALILLPVDRNRLTVLINNPKNAKLVKYKRKYVVPISTVSGSIMNNAIISFVKMWMIVVKFNATIEAPLMNNKVSSRTRFVLPAPKFVPATGWNAWLIPHSKCRQRFGHWVQHWILTANGHSHKWIPYGKLSSAE